MAVTITQNVDISLPVELVKQIQSKSEMPALEGFVGILTRIVKEHEKAYPNSSKHVVLTVPARQEPTHFKTQRGFDLPIGLELLADYRGKKLTAKVTSSGIEYKGKRYEVSPSAFAAKKDCGATDTSASTNGWKFWQYRNDRGQLSFIDTFRAS